MMRVNRFLPLSWAVISLCFVSGSAVAKGNDGETPAKHFGLGQPRTTQDLPPGLLRKQLDQLSPRARGKALQKLQSITFPAEDVTTLRVTRHGGIHYADTPPSERTEPVSDFSTQTADTAISAEQAFKLHSRPGSNNVLYLDFDGHTIPAGGWKWSDLEALPFDPSGNDSPATVASFTQDELNRIHEIWHRVAEDFSAFDIDVTTQEPAVFTTTTGHVVFTHDIDANGQSMPSVGAGGTAFVDVFGNDDYATWSPALVYYTNLSPTDYGLANYCADAAAHEFGHNLGLAHDGTLSGDAYYSGHGEGHVSWAPVMGRPFDRNVTQWSNGDYPDANNPQDDLGTMLRKLGPRPDDHGDSGPYASPLIVEDNGDIIASSPQNDPDNVLDQNKGVIEDAVDTDWFYIDVTGTGTLELTATPAWNAFYRDDKRGSNLDIALSVFDADRSEIAFADPEDDTWASVSLGVTSGRYYVVVDGVGNHSYSNYSDYASTGMYFLEGHVSAEIFVDDTPPTPAIMDWDSAPTANGTSSITMTAVTASDDSGSIEYFFSCTAGGPGCADSGWQASRSFVADGLQPDTYYAFTVRARDGSGNETQASPTAGATTDPLPQNQPPVAVASFTPDPALIERGNAVDVVLDGSASYDPDGALTTWSWTDSTGAAVADSATTALKLREGSYSFTLTVTDNEDASTSVTVEVIVAKPAAEDSGSGGNSNNGKGKPPKG